MQLATHYTRHVTQHTWLKNFIPYSLLVNFGVHVAMIRTLKNEMKCASFSFYLFLHSTFSSSRQRAQWIHPQTELQSSRKKTEERILLVLTFHLQSLSSKIILGYFNKTPLSLRFSCQRSSFDTNVWDENTINLLVRRINNQPASFKCARAPCRSSCPFISKANKIIIVINKNDHASFVFPFPHSTYKVTFFGCLVSIDAVHPSFLHVWTV